MEYKFLTVVNIKIAVLWDVPPCSLVEAPMLRMNLRPEPYRGASQNIAIFSVTNLNSCIIVIEPEYVFISFTDKRILQKWESGCVIEICCKSGICDRPIAKLGNQQLAQ
jgi:hypothetical protein